MKSVGGTRGGVIIRWESFKGKKEWVVLEELQESLQSWGTVN